MKTNSKAVDYRVDVSNRLAGGFGNYAASQNDENLLRRSVLACLLWEDLFYEKGGYVVKDIKSYIPKVNPEAVYNIAIEARTKQKLRHVPLLIASEMLKYPEHKKYVGDLLPKIILRVDELAEFLSIYWLEGKCPIAKQAKIGLASSFSNFDEYQFAKYNRDTQIKLRDVMFLVHPKPVNKYQEHLFKKIADNSLSTPDTWEVSLSAGKDKKDTFTRLIQEHKLGALAFLRNLKNIYNAGVGYETIKYGFDTVNPRWLVPTNFYLAYKNNPQFGREIESLMFKGFSQAEKLPGHTILVVDVSGSMGSLASSNSVLTRLQVAYMLAMVTAETCERISVYATAGSDSNRLHRTSIVPPYRGFALADAIGGQARFLGGGGIFTRQCLEYIREDQRDESPDRIIIFSDSQDCDIPSRRIPAPFGKYNYIVDISSHARGVYYNGIWTAEISGWSDYFLDYIRCLEGLSRLSSQDQD